MGFRGGGKHEVEMLLCCSYKVGKGRELRSRSGVGLDEKVVQLVVAVVVAQVEEILHQNRQSLHQLLLDHPPQNRQSRRQIHRHGHGHGHGHGCHHRQDLIVKWSLDLLICDVLATLIPGQWFF